jgi:hypothetical protein
MMLAKFNNGKRISLCSAPVSGRRYSNPSELAAFSSCHFDSKVSYNFFSIRISR